MAPFDDGANPHVPTVLFQGETGTGKGLIARVIHDSGPRRAGPFVDVNCAAIPDALLESELFGFDSGAFTDARHPKPGLFEVASSGTLFLDEIETLPLALQGKLLKAIEDKRARRLGAVRDVEINVKLVAATQVDLHAWVGERGSGRTSITGSPSSSCMSPCSGTGATTSCSSPASFHAIEATARLLATVDDRMFGVGRCSVGVSHQPRKGRERHAECPARHQKPRELPDGVALFIGVLTHFGASQITPALLAMPR